MNRKTFSKYIKRLVRRIFRREIIVLPLNGTGAFFDVSEGQFLLPVQYTYRASPQGLVSYHFLTSGLDLRYVLSSMEYLDRDPVIGQPCISVNFRSIKPGDVLQINLLEQEAFWNDKRITCERGACRPVRKFIAHLEMSGDSGVLRRFCSHYLPFENKPIGKDYYFGDDYTEYPLHTDISFALDLVRRFCDGGRLLDVGCALGIYTKAFSNAGFDAYGIDISEFAIYEAQKLLGEERIQQCDMDQREIPFDLPFNVFWMWDVLEHSADPGGMLRKISKNAVSGSYLFLRTSNADSLTHRIFETDWEGYSDYSHYGADQVSVKNLHIWLDDSEWDVVDWNCSQIWIFGNDPINLRLREVFEQIPEMKTLLAERELGDAIQVVARKR